MKMDSHSPTLLTWSLTDQDVPSSALGSSYPASPKPQPLNTTVDWALGPGTKVRTLSIPLEQGLAWSWPPGSGALGRARQRQCHALVMNCGNCIKFYL